MVNQMEDVIPRRWRQPVDGLSDAVAAENVGARGDDLKEIKIQFIFISFNHFRMITT
jgi:hypothetical protein